MSVVCVVVNHEPAGYYDSHPGDCVSDLLRESVVGDDVGNVLVWIGGALVEHSHPLKGVSEVILTYPCTAMGFPPVSLKAQDGESKAAGARVSHVTPMDILSTRKHVGEAMVGRGEFKHECVQAVVMGNVEEKGLLHHVGKQAVANDVLVWRNMLVHSWGIHPRAVRAAHGSAATTKALDQNMALASQGMGEGGELDTFVLVLEGMYSAEHNTFYLQEGDPITLPHLHSLVSKVPAKTRFVFLQGLAIDDAVAGSVAPIVRGDDENTVVFSGLMQHSTAMRMHIRSPQRDVGHILHAQRKAGSVTQGWCRGRVSSVSLDGTVSDIVFSDNIFGRNVKWNQCVDFSETLLLHSMLVLIGLDGDPHIGVVPEAYIRSFRNLMKDKVVSDGKDRHTISAANFTTFCNSRPDVNFDVSAHDVDVVLPVRNRPNVLTIWDEDFDHQEFVGKSFLDIRIPHEGRGPNKNAHVLLVGKFADGDGSKGGLFRAGILNELATMKDVFTSSSVFNIDPGCVTTMVGGLGVNKKVILDHLQALAKRSETAPLDIFVFFFIGHGVQAFSRVGVTSGITADDKEVIGGRELVTELQSVRATRTVGFINACYSGSVVSKDGSNYMITSVDGRETKYGGMLLIASAAPWQMSFMDFSLKRTMRVGDTAWVSRKGAFHRNTWVPATITRVHTNGTLDTLFRDGLEAKELMPEMCADLTLMRSMNTASVVAALQGAHTCPLGIPHCGYCSTFREVVRMNADRAREEGAVDGTDPLGLVRGTDLWKYVDNHFSIKLPFTSRPFGRLVGFDFELCPTPIARDAPCGAAIVPRPPTYAMEGFAKPDISFVSSKVGEVLDDPRRVVPVQTRDAASLVQFGHILVGELGRDEVVTHFCLRDIDPMSADAKMVAQNLAFQMVRKVPTFGTFLKGAMGGDVARFFETRSGMECLRAVLFDALCAVKVSVGRLTIIIVNAHELPKHEVAFMLLATEGLAFPHWARVVLLTTESRGDARAIEI